MAQRPLERTSSLTPVSFELYSKIVQITRSDTTAFDAFVFPKGAVLAGTYVIAPGAAGSNSNAGTSALIHLGSNPGTTNEILGSYDVKVDGRGHQIAKNALGTLAGTVNPSDLLVKAVYAETGTASSAGGPWLVKVEYYFPQTGQSW